MAVEVAWTVEPDGRVYLEFREPGRFPHRHSVWPTTDPEVLAELPPSLQASLAVLWTPQFVAAWHAEFNPKEPES